MGITGRYTVSGLGVCRLREWNPSNHIFLLRPEYQLPAASTFDLAQVPMAIDSNELHIASNQILLITLAAAERNAQSNPYPTLMYMPGLRNRRAFYM